MDVANESEVHAVVSDVKPDVIVHAAAIPNQLQCDQNVDLARKVNVGGTRNVALAAEEVGAKVVLISTNAVLVPKNYGTYGTTKLESEKVLQKLSQKYVILRPGLIIGQSPNSENDRFPNRLLNNIIKRVPAAYDDSERLEVTWVGHISEVIIKVEEKNIIAQTIPVIVDEYKTKFEIARDILSNFGVQVAPKEERKLAKGPYATIEKLQELGMPIYNYRTILDKTVQEIKVQLRDMHAL